MNRGIMRRNSVILILGGTLVLGAFAGTGAPSHSAHATGVDPTAIAPDRARLLPDRPDAIPHSGPGGPVAASPTPAKLAAVSPTAGLAAASASPTSSAGSAPASDT